MSLTMQDSCSDMFGILGAATKRHRLTSAVIAISGLFLSMMLSPVGLKAQTSSSTITGRILDVTGAAVPDAQVEVKNEGTGIVSKGTSDESGLYTVTLLPTGRFTITATKTGFTTFVDQNVFLAPASVLHYTISLQVGEVSTRIAVTAAAPVIQAETGELSALQTQKLFKYNPQPNYTLCSPNAQAMLTPGSSQRAYLSFLGNRPFQTKLQINGLDIAQYGSPFGSGSQEGVEATKTYDLLAPAEYAQPATVDSTTRSGTNQFHGSAGVNMENLALNAVGPFTFKRPSGRPFTTTIINAGGPIYIPKLYDGRNRSFWFFSWNTRTRYGALPVTQNVPTDAMRAGDYNGVVTTLRNPFTGQTFTSPQIPASMINPTSVKIQDQVFRHPDVVTLNGVQNITNFAAFNENRRHQTQLTGDHSLTDRHKIMVTWLEGGQFRPRSPALCGPALTLPGNLAGFLDNIDNARVNTIQTSLGSTISPTMFNEFRFSYNRAINRPTVSLTGDDVVRSFGLQGISSRPGTAGSPTLNILGFAQVVNQGQTDQVDQAFQYQDNLTWIAGRHEVKMGFAVKNYMDRVITAPSGTFGGFTFSGRFTGHSYADFLLGLPDTATLFSPRPELDRRSSEAGFYIQESFKVTPKLTLNYGVRWQTYTVGKDENDLYFNFDPVSGALVVPSESALQFIHPAFPKTIPIKTAAQAGFPDHLINGDSSFFPRFSFAYRLTQTAVIRGGYGIYAIPPYAIQTGDARVQTAGPFALNQTFTNTVDGGTALIQFPQAVPVSNVALSSVSGTGVTKDYRLPYNQQWNLTFEKEVWHNSFRFSYIGQKDTQIAYTHDINLPAPSTTAFSLSRLIYPGFRNMAFTENGGNSTYHAFQFNLTRPLRSGLTFQGGYTWAKSLTDVPATEFQAYTAAVENPYDRAAQKGRNFIVPSHDFRIQLVYDLPVGKGKTWLTSPQGFSEGLLNQIVGNWTISGITGINSGTWSTPSFSGNDPSGMGLFGGRPDVVPNCDPNIVPGGRTREKFWNIDCFQAPASNIGRIGNAGVGILDGPNFFGLDFGAFKDFILTGSSNNAYLERNPLRLRFGVVAANILNHASLDLPARNISSPANFGRITATTWGIMPFQFPSPRTIQFRALLDF